MPGHPAFAGFAFLGLGAVLLLLAIRQGAMPSRRWTGASGMIHTVGGWQLCLSIVFATCGLFSLWHHL